MSIYDESARYYDAIYERLVDQRAGAAALRRHITERNPRADSLIEAACGTGLMLAQLSTDIRVAGFDRSPAMIERARIRLPTASLAVADMTIWTTDERYDVIVCVGSSIGYVRTEELLRQTLAGFARHLAPGGLVLIEPWFPPGVWEDGRQGFDVVDQPALKLARLATSGRDGTLSVLDLDFLVGVEGRVERFTERHIMGLFTDRQMRDAFSAAGLNVEHDATYPTGRGLYVGQRPAGDLVSAERKGSAPSGSGPAER